MKRFLIIFEWPWKFTTVNKYKYNIEKLLWGKVELAATFWHILSSPWNELWIKIKEKNWKYEFDYTLKPVSATAKKAIKELKDKIESVRKSWWKIIFATDQDRAWEMIAKEVVDNFKLKKWEYLRAPLTSVEKEDFLDLLKNWLLNELNKNYYSAEEVRMILDKLWGYVKSPVLYKRLNDNTFLFGKLNKLISALKKKKEKFIEENEKYLTDERVRTFLKRVNDMINWLEKYMQWQYWKKPLYKSSIWRVQLPMNKLIIMEWLKSFKKIEAKNYIKAIDENNFKWSMEQLQIEKMENKEIHIAVKEIKKYWKIDITSIEVKNKKMKSKKPYNETSLVSDANWILWFSPKKTSSIVQKLYEKGITTYYRTKWDWFTPGSYNFIVSLLNKQGSWKEIDTSKTYSLWKDAWHDAIRPSFKWQIKLNSNLLYEPAWQNLSEDEIKIFDLIYRRTLASIMKDADIITLSIKWTSNKKYKFELKINFIKNEWFLALYHWWKRWIWNLLNLKDKEKTEKQYSKWNAVKIKDVELEEWKFQFNDSVSFNNFKSTLENKKIWTPATFVPIFDKIKEKEYTMDIWKSKLVPLAKWIAINYITDDIEVNNLDFTEELLWEIEAIEEWKLNKDKLLNEIFKKYFIDAYNDYQNFTFRKSWWKKKNSYKRKK